MRSRTIGKDLTAALVAAGLSLMLAPAATSHGSSSPKIKIGTLKIKKQGYFYTAGEYADPVEKDHMVGQMYVEYANPGASDEQVPDHHGPRRQPVGRQLHGHTRPPSRLGVHDIPSRGWPVYVVDQAASGRSPYTAESAPRGTYTAKSREDAFMAIEIANTWPEFCSSTRSGPAPACAAIPLSINS